MYYNSYVLKVVLNLGLFYIWMGFCLRGNLWPNSLVLNFGLYRLYFYESSFHGENLLICCTYHFVRWLGFILDMLGNVVVLCAGVFAVQARDTITPGLTGLSVSYSLQVRPGSYSLQVRPGLLTGLSVSYSLQVRPVLL